MLRELKKRTRALPPTYRGIPEIFEHENDAAIEGNDGY